MPSARDILKFSLSEKFFDQVMVSHRNVVTVGTTYKKCGTLQQELVIKKMDIHLVLYLIHSPLGIWKHRNSFKESTVDCIKIDSPPNLSEKERGVKRGEGTVLNLSKLLLTSFQDVGACSSKAMLSALHLLFSQKAAYPRIFLQLKYF